MVLPQSQSLLVPGSPEGPAMQALTHPERMKWICWTEKGRGVTAVWAVGQGLYEELAVIWVAKSQRLATCWHHT